MISARYRALAIAGVIALSLTACSGQATSEEEANAESKPIEVVSAPDYQGEPISLDLPVHSSGAFEFDQWPSACELTDEETIKAVLPDVVEISQESLEANMTIITFGSGNEEVTIPEASCITRTGFDMDGLRLADGNVVVNLAPRVIQAGNDEYMERNGTLPPGEEVTLGDTPCVQSPSTITCNTGHLLFAIQIDARPYEQYGHPEGSLYTVDGEDIDYSEDTESFTKMMEQKVLQPIAELAANRLSL